MTKALEKRPVSCRGDRAGRGARLSQAARARRARGAALTIGELVMEELRHLDEVGLRALRLGVSRFQDVEAFREEIERLRHHRRRRDETVEQDQLPLLPRESADAEPKS